MKVSLEDRPLLEVRNLKKYYPLKRGFFLGSKEYVYAVNGINIRVYRGETLGIVGESGCGKSTTALCILRLIEPTEGEIFFEGQNICGLNRKELRPVRKEMQMIFQDPFTSLDPRSCVEDIIGEPLEVHKSLARKEKRRYVANLLIMVGLQPEHMRRYPHEFSGGQRQRIGIARAIALNPKLIVCDEPVSSLDVSIQAQIINLMVDLQKDLGLSYLLISHDLSVVSHICDRIAVMYLGKIVEMASVSDLYFTPKHPYTQALLAAVPIPDPKRKSWRIVLRGDVQGPTRLEGCCFHHRCEQKMEKCEMEVPNLEDIGNDHLVACHLH